MANKRQKTKLTKWEYIKLYGYSLIGMILAIVFLLTLNYLQFYVHELGHANSVVLYTFTQKSPTLAINFTYIDFLGKDYLKVPQQTIALIPKPMLVYGVLFTMVFYALIFLLLTKLKIIKENKILQYPLAISLVLLVLQDIVLNLFCGTDGLRLNCGGITITILSFIFNALLLLSLGFFFVELIILIKNKNSNRGGKKLLKTSEGSEK